ncbi:hypothetical protein HMPREF0262_00619 [Clostridium sp. ATCC 29733]|nr:hypothetical protein HMPREF0262_00619 [Clostridium sp. ATCC 29733]
MKCCFLAFSIPHFSPPCNQNAKKSACLEEGRISQKHRNSQ